MTEAQSLPDQAASTSTQDKSNTAKAESIATRDLQRERDNRREEAPKASAAPRRSRTLRVAGLIATLLVVLGVGWGAGVKGHEWVDVAQVAAWFEDNAGILVKSLDDLRKHTTASIEGLAPAYQRTDELDRGPSRSKAAEVIDPAASVSSTRTGQLGASSESAIRELRTVIQRLNGSVERSQREVLAKLDQLQERLERVETPSVGVLSSGHAQPLEKLPAAKNAPLPLPSSASPKTAVATKPAAAPQTKRIENWAVMEVVDGMAVLAGPRGLIEVSDGDVVPGLGRVESISRRRGEWVVATSKGVIRSR